MCRIFLNMVRKKLRNRSFFMQIEEKTPHVAPFAAAIPLHETLQELPMVRKNPTFVAVVILGLLGGQLQAATAPRPDPASALPADATLLDRSQIAYRAEGGFTGVESYSVIISCVRGEV